MPSGNRMGPRGEGPNTGRGLGYCADNDQPGYVESQTGQGFGRGFGRGGGGWRGRNRPDAAFYPRQGRGRFEISATPASQEVNDLKAQTQELQNVLQGIQDRLAELEAEK